MIKTFNKGSINIIMYHYVREIKKSKFKNLKGLEFKKFRNQINDLKKSCHVLDLNDLKEILNKQKIPKQKFCLLSFDDGYTDHYDYVFQELSEKKISGFFYVPSKIIQNNTILDVNKIHFLLEKLNDTKKILNEIKKILNKYKIDLDKLRVDKIDLKSKYDSMEVILIKRLLQYFLPKKLRSKIINYLFNKFVTSDEISFSKELYLSKKKIIEMSKEKMFFGCHGDSHEWYEHMDSKQINKDINSSENFFKKIDINIQDAGIAYPYGSFNNKTLEIVKKKQYLFGLTTVSGAVNRHNLKKKLLYPRIDTNEIG